MNTLYIVTIGLLCSVVSTSGWAMSKKAPALENVSATPTASASPMIDSIWVGKSDEAKACAKERGISLDTMADQLKNSKIPVLASKKIHDGKMRIQMCGVDKGDMNGFLIAKKDFDRAKDLGYQLIPTALAEQP